MAKPESDGIITHGEGEVPDNIVNFVALRGHDKATHRLLKEGSVEKIGETLSHHARHWGIIVRRVAPVAAAVAAGAATGVGVYKAIEHFQHRGTKEKE